MVRSSASGPRGGLRLAKIRSSQSSNDSDKERAHNTKLGYNPLVLDGVRNGRIFARLFVHRAFEASALIIIVVNAVWIGVEVDWRDQMNPLFHSTVENMFCLVFLCELIVRMMAYLPRVTMFFFDPQAKMWNWCDFFLVCAMILDSWVLEYMVSVDQSGLSVLSAFRLIRLCRVTRLFRMVPELGILVTGMVAAMRTVSSTCALAVGITYIFSILFTQWVRNLVESGAETHVYVLEGGHPYQLGCEGDVPPDGLCFRLEDVFGTLGGSMISLVQVILIDNTFEIVRPVFFRTVQYGWLMIVFILLVGFTVMNMLIGVICDVISESNQVEKLKLKRMRLEAIFAHNGPGASEIREYNRHDVVRIATAEKARLASLGITEHIMKNAIHLMKWVNDSVLVDDFYEALFGLLRPIDTEDILRIKSSITHVCDAFEDTQERHKDMMRESTASWDLDMDEVITDATPSEQPDEVDLALERLENLAARAKELRTFPMGTPGIATPALNPSLAAEAAGGGRSQLRDIGPLRTYLRVLGAQMHALRAELKAAEMLYGSADSVGRGVEAALGLDGAILKALRRVARVRELIPGAGLAEVSAPPSPAASPRRACGQRKLGPLPSGGECGALEDLVPIAGNGEAAESSAEEHHI